MFSFWLRELAGWLLVGLGALILYDCLQLLTDRRVFEAGPLSIIGIVLFRGGIHLLKVAVAARICLKARERIAEDRQASRSSRREPATPVTS